MKPPLSKSYAPTLWLLLALFVARVVGQVLVAFAHVSFLPPMSEWYSGLLPYPYLLLSQVLVIALLVKVSVDFSRGRGFFVQPRASFARGALLFGGAYLLSMVVRYAVHMTRHPEARWFGQTIPIALHCVLAGYVLVFGTFHRRQGAARGSAAGGLGRVVSLAFLLLSGSGCGALVSRAMLPRTPTRPAEYDVDSERMTMTTSDGVALVSDVYRPRGTDKTPTVLVRIPFARGWQNEAATGVLGNYWARRGYTVVLQGTRGRFRSGGEYYPLRHERQDGLETLTWLRGQPWFDGRLGMWGASGFGYTQWVLADQFAADSSAVMLQVCSSGVYDMFYPGGAFSLETALYWALRDRGNKTGVPSTTELDRGARGFPLVEADDRASEDVPVFDDWVSHPERDDYWNALDGEDRAGVLQAPAFLMAGWFDPFLPAQLRDFERLRSGRGRAAAEARLVIGPWAHARNLDLPDGPEEEPFRRESLAPTIEWFDRHLMGKATSERLPPVRIYVMGENVWRDEQEWPLARAELRSWYLRSGGRANTAKGDGRLDLASPAASEPADRYIYDPRDPVPSAGGVMLGPRAGIARQEAVERRQDVLVYTSEPLTGDVEVTGPVALVLHVATSAPNTDFTAKLVDVHADDAAYNVSEGALRRGFPPGAAAGRDEPVEIRIELWPTSMLFRKGHRLRLEVSSSNFPRFDRNPNTGGAIATETEAVTAVQSVFHEAALPSRLVLPVVSRS